MAAAGAAVAQGLSRLGGYSRMKDKQLQQELLKDLRALDEHQHEIGTPLVLIGGWAVSSYTRSTRMTHDADFAASKQSVNRLMALLKSLGYDCQKHPNQISAIKWVGDEAIKLRIHIAIDGVFDEITLSRYPLTDEELMHSPRRLLKPFFARLKSTEMPVARIEDLFLMKLLPLRGRDVLDACLLLLESYAEFDLHRCRAKASADELKDIYQQRFAQLAERIRTGDLRVEYQRQLNRRLTAQEEKLILTRLRNIAKR
ncbi:MAG: hypothetical protein HOP19_01395 [Acidobacteria bacterium]|nr:hypothetical protein [Acidobacteriota bacterium]